MDFDYGYADQTNTEWRAIVNEARAMTTNTRGSAAEPIICIERVAPDILRHYRKDGSGGQLIASPASIDAIYEPGMWRNDE